MVATLCSLTESCSWKTKGCIQILSCIDLEAPWRYHHLHYPDHILSGLIVLLPLCLHICWDSSVILWFQLFVLNVGVCHNPWYLFEVLEDSESWTLKLRWHELHNVVVRIDLRRCTSHLVECVSYTRSWPLEHFTAMDIRNYSFVLSRTWASLQEVSLSEKLRVVMGWLDLLVIIERLSQTSYCTSVPGYKRAVWQLLFLRCCNSFCPIWWIFIKFSGWSIFGWRW